MQAAALFAPSGLKTSPEGANLSPEEKQLRRFYASALEALYGLWRTFNQAAQMPGVWLLFTGDAAVP